MRRYHAKGLLPEPERDHSGYRRYDAAAVVDLIRVRTLADAESGQCACGPTGAAQIQARREDEKRVLVDQILLDQRDHQM